MAEAIRDGKLSFSEAYSLFATGTADGGDAEGQVFPAPFGERGCFTFPAPVSFPEQNCHKIFLPTLKKTIKSRCLPHARGGVSADGTPVLLIMQSSPRPWGCFWGREWGARPTGVFPTPVGVFLARHSLWRRRASLPHARGGVSPRYQEKFREWLSSPRPWGCFRLLNVHPQQKKSSPRPWGCFYGGCPGQGEAGVFPTPVGVFPPAHCLGRTRSGLPHARGGVSTSLCKSSVLCMSSPRPWGCFPACPSPSCIRPVFPTPVGVFLVVGVDDVVAAGLPHARGGVSLTRFSSFVVTGSSPRPWGCFHCRLNLERT